MADIIVTTPTYTAWASVPDGLRTKTQLREMRLKPAKGQGCAAWFDGKYGKYCLYSKDEAIPVREMSKKQKDNLDKAREASKTKSRCKGCGTQFPFGRSRRHLNSAGNCHSCSRDLMIERVRRESVKECRSLLGADDWVVVDFESTGLGPDAEIVQIGIVSHAGEVLYAGNVNPTTEIELGAYKVHGISAEDLESSPSWVDIAGEVNGILDGKRVVAYSGAEVGRIFDCKVLEQTNARYGVLAPSITEWVSALDIVSRWWGEWSEYHGNFKYQGLQYVCHCFSVELSEAHNAVADATATRLVLVELANEELEEDEKVSC